MASIAKVRRDYLEEEAEEAAKEEAEENAETQDSEPVSDPDKDKQAEQNDINRLLDRAEQDKKDE